MLTVHAYIEVTDLARGIEFYCDGLGLTQNGNSAPVGLSLQALICRFSSSPTARLTRDFGRHWTPVHLDFIVTNLDEMVERLCGLGVTLDCEIQIREYGRMANMGDPFGNGFDLIEFSGPGYDNIKH